MLHKYEVTFQRLAETKMSIARLKPRHSTLRGIHIHLYVIDVTLYSFESPHSDATLYNLHNRCHNIGGKRRRKLLVS